MKTKPFLVGALVAAIVNFFLGYLWYVVLFAEQYGNTDNPDGNMAMIFVGMLLGTLALAAVYDKWAAGEHSLMGGLKFGALVGLIPGLSYAVVMYGTGDFSVTVTALESAYGIVAFGLSGAIIGFIYSTMDKKAA